MQNENAYRLRLIKRLRTYTSDPSIIERTREYNAGLAPGDVKSIVSGPYAHLAAIGQFEAIGDALEGKPDWARDLGRTLQYLMLVDRCQWFWHQQFRELFPAHPQPLQIMSWEGGAHTMAFCYMLGWVREAEYQGFLVHAALNRGYQLQLSYHEEKRRGAAFLLRLFASSCEGARHDWPAWAFETGVYERLLANWRDPDPAAVKPLLLDACQHHLAQSHARRADDYGDVRLARTPLEIHMVLRLRERAGLALPELEHPLMTSPFAHLLSPIPVPPPDELMLGTLARARLDWPQFDARTSLESVRKAAAM